LGVEIITQNTKDKLITNRQGAFIKRASGRIEPIGFIFLNQEHSYVNGSHPSLRGILAKNIAAHIIEEDLPEGEGLEIRNAALPDPITGKINGVALEAAIRKEGYGSTMDHYLKDEISGLVDAMASGKVATNYSPGVDFIGDKEFYSYVDRMVQYYLPNEVPLLTSIRTRSFSKSKSGSIELDGISLQKLFEGEHKKLVFKIPDGRGGKGVWIGPKMNQGEIRELEKIIVENYKQIQVVDFIHLPVLEDRLVDLRMITDVGPKSVNVANTPWGRGIPIQGNGKVNISDQGREVMIGVVKDPPRSKTPILSCIALRLRKK
ncbi:MAG: circularly permuted type 2 ATP-grasp protein, partial [Bdellovibrionota bacterium]